jgi:hypothetical protein
MAEIAVIGEDVGMKVENTHAKSKINFQKPSQCTRRIQDWIQQPFAVELHVSRGRCGRGDDVLEIWLCATGKSVLDQPNQDEEVVVDPGGHIGLAWAVMDEKSRMRSAPLHTAGDCGQIKCQQLHGFDGSAGYVATTFNAQGNVTPGEFADG